MVCVLCTVLLCLVGAVGQRGDCKRAGEGVTR